jgi:predicted O-methyltransferase YrrM
MALENTGGHLTTYEIRKKRVELARQNFEEAGVSERVTVVHGDAHEEVTKLEKPIDLVFLDADKQGYLDYLQKLLPLVRPGGLIVAHNMTRSMADPRYVEAVTEDAELETFFVHEPGGGMGVTVKKR